MYTWSAIVKTFKLSKMPHNISIYSLEGPFQFV
jgi:hypothetical protein